VLDQSTLKSSFASPKMAPSSNRLLLTTQPVMLRATYFKSLTLVLGLLAVNENAGTFADEKQSEIPARSDPDSPTTDPTTLEPQWLAPAWHPETGLLSKHIRPEEAAAYFTILNHARKLSPQQLKDAATQFETERRTIVRKDPAYRYYFRKPEAQFPTFVDLYRAPEAYHGRLVTFHGHVRRLVSYPAGKNDLGFEQLHEAWLYTDEAQQNPVVVVCTELPPQVPVGSDILIDFVSATGYFFKRYGYNDRNGEPRFAPLILARRLEWTPPPQRTHWISPAAAFGLTVGAGFVIVALWWRSTKRTRIAIHHATDDAPITFAQDSLTPIATATEPPIHGDEKHRVSD
jgi:hypothetical protein